MDGLLLDALYAKYHADKADAVAMGYYYHSGNYGEESMGFVVQS